jgi:hypothetical protein
MPFLPPLDERTWQLVKRETSPPGIFSHTVEASLPFRSDVALVTVAMLSNDADWVRAGYINQIWDRGQGNNDYYLLNREMVYLRTSKVFALEPIDNSILYFKPMDWLFDWTINIEASPYIES